MKKLILIMAVAVLLVTAGSAQATSLYDFETGLNGWTVTGGFAQSSSYANENGTYGLVSGLNSTGTATSPNFVIDANTLQFMVGGQGNDAANATAWDHGGFYDNQTMAQMSQYWQLIRVIDNAVLSRGTGPFQDNGRQGGQVRPIDGPNGFVGTYMIDTSRYIGQTVKLVLTDTLGTTVTTGGTPTAGIWFGIDNVRTADRTSATSVFTCELPDESNWTLSGNTFQFAAVASPEYQNGGGASALLPREGGEFLRSFSDDSSRSGTATSANFTLTRQTLELQTTGFNNANRGGTCHIYLKKTSDNTTLYEFTAAAGGDGWANLTKDVSAWAGMSVYLQLTDPSTDGWWIGVDDVRLTGNSTVPEIDVQGNSTSIADGDTTPSTGDWTDFGATLVGAPLSRTFTIYNTGGVALSIAASNLWTVPTGFTVTDFPTTSIGAGLSDTFTVQLNAASAGTYTGQISFGNGDSDENPYNFTIEGDVFAPVAEPSALALIGLGLLGISRRRK